MRRPLGLGMSVLGLLAVIACADDPPALPTQGSDVALATSSLCATMLDKQIASEQNSLFKGGTLKAARDAWALVVEACSGSTLTVPQDRMLQYVALTIDQFDAGNVLTPKPGSAFATAAQAVVGHWNTVFQYVGLDAPGLDAGVLDGDGAAAVFDDDVGGTLLTDLRTAGLHVAAGAPRTSGGSQDAIGYHLYAILRSTSPSCLSTNLEQHGGCYEAEAHPAVEQFIPLVVVGVCGPSDPHADLVLGRGAQNGTRLTAAVNVDPFDDAIGPCPASSSLGTDRGAVLAFLHRAGGSVAELAGNLLDPAPLYAGHGGLTGGSVGLSPFTGVDPLVFRGTFTNDVLGQPPSQSPLTAPDKGRWTWSVSAPGTIVVRASIGDLTDTAVVLDQGGGNCGTACGGLHLTGTLFSADQTGATIGAYRVSWQSLQDRPTLKEAPFVLRDSNGRAIATLKYISVPGSGNQLVYVARDESGSGVVADTLRVLWTQSRKQRFEIDVDLDRKRTVVRVITGTTAAPARRPYYTFQDPSAADLHTVGAEFSGIDAGIMGWDDITVERLRDYVATSP